MFFFITSSTVRVLNSCYYWNYFLFEAKQIHLKGLVLQLRVEPPSDGRSASLGTSESSSQGNALELYSMRVFQENTINKYDIPWYITRV